MTNEDLKHVLETGKLKLSFWNKFSHYGIVGFLIIIPTTLVFLHLKAYFEEIQNPLKEGEILFIIIPVILAVFFYLLQRNRLKFKTVETSLNRGEIDLIIKRVSNELEWMEFIYNDKIIVAKTHPGFLSGSWGEQITILLDKNVIFINSICDPNKQSSIVSMGRNKQNENKLIEEIELATKQAIL